MSKATVVVSIRTGWGEYMGWVALAPCSHGTSDPIHPLKMRGNRGWRLRVALRGDRDQTRRKVPEGGNHPCRLYWLGVELSHGQALSLGRQIAESIDRERLARTQAPDPEEPMTDTVPVSR
jgi:hypothetical protein